MAQRGDVRRPGRLARARTSHRPRVPSRAGARDRPLDAMYARAVEQAAERLCGLRREKWERLSLAALALVLAVVAAAILPELAVPLLVGGLGIGVLGLRALVRHWDLVERLSGERDAYVIPEVLACASREAEIERRQTLAAMIRSHLRQPGLVSRAGVLAAAEELEALARDLDDRALALDPAAAVACMRLLTGIDGSPLFRPGAPTRGPSLAHLPDPIRVQGAARPDYDGIRATATCVRTTARETGAAGEVRLLPRRIRGRLPRTRHRRGRARLALAQAVVVTPHSLGRRPHLAATALTR